MPAKYYTDSGERSAPARAPTPTLSRTSASTGEVFASIEDRKRAGVTREQTGYEPSPTEQRDISEGRITVEKVLEKRRKEIIEARRKEAEKRAELTRAEREKLERIRKRKETLARPTPYLRLAQREEKIVRVAPEPTVTPVSAVFSQKYFKEVMPSALIGIPRIKVSRITTRILKETKDLEKRYEKLRKKELEEIKKLEEPFKVSDVFELERRDSPLKFSILPTIKMPALKIKIENILKKLEVRKQKLVVAEEERFKERIAREKLRPVEKELIGTAKSFEGAVKLGFLGVARGLLGLYSAAKNPPRFAKEQYEMWKTPIKTLARLRDEFMIDPVGMIAEFWTFGKGLKLTGAKIKSSPVGRWIREEFWIRKMPKEMRKYGRAIIKSSNVQAKINPYKIKSIKNVDFLEIKNLTKVEAKALLKTMKDPRSQSVLFGSGASYILGKKKTSIPKDLDIGVANKNVFLKIFLDNMPKKIRRNYTIRKGRFYRGNKKFIDVKHISELIPGVSIWTKRGYLPVSGFVKKIKGVEQVKTILNLVKDIERLKIKIPKTLRERTQNFLLIKKLQKQLRREKSRIRFSELPKLQRKAVSGALDVPTRKLVEVEGIKMVGFGEQTVRKGLGTLQVLIERNARRAKDPQAFLVGLKIQLDSLKRAKPLTILGKRKIRVLENAIKVLSSKGFQRLLESKVPGILKRYPLPGKIDTKKLRKTKPTTVKRIVNKQIRIRNDLRKIDVELKVLSKKKVRTVKDNVKFNSLARQKKKLDSSIKTTEYFLPKHRPSRLPKFRPSKIPKPSKLPSKIPSKLPKPSKIPSKLPPSRLPLSQLPTRLPSRIPRSILSRLPSVFPRSALPRSISKLPSKLPKPSKIPKPKPPEVPRTKKFILEKKKKEKEKKKLVKSIIAQDFWYLSDLYSRIYNVYATKLETKRYLKPGRLFTGVGIRKKVKRPGMKVI